MGVIKTIVFEDGKGTQLQFLDTGGKLIPIFLENENLVNAKVSVIGALNDKGFIVPDKVEVLEQPKAPLDIPVSGSRNVLVLLLNFTNDTSQPISVEEARNVVFTGNKSANAFY